MEFGIPRVIAISKGSVNRLCSFSICSSSVSIRPLGFGSCFAFKGRTTLDSGAIRVYLLETVGVKTREISLSSSKLGILVTDRRDCPDPCSGVLKAELKGVLNADSKEVEGVVLRSNFPSGETSSFNPDDLRARVPKSLPLKLDFVGTSLYSRLRDEGVTDGVLVIARSDDADDLDTEFSVAD